MNGSRLMLSCTLMSLFLGCSEPEADLIGSWKRTQYLDAYDELTQDFRTGVIMDFNEDKSFEEKYLRDGRSSFGGREREKKGTWAWGNPVEKDDVGELVMRYDESGSVLEQRVRVRELTLNTMRLIGPDGAERTAVFERR